MGLEEQHHQNGLVVYLSKNGNGHSIDHNEEGAFFSWFLKEDSEGKKFLPYLKDRFVECEFELLSYHIYFIIVEAKP